VTLQADPKKWCEACKDRRAFVGQSTHRGEVVDLYADEYDPSCQYIAGTGLYVRDGHRPAKVT
jgi:hypothetical protein